MGQIEKACCFTGHRPKYFHFGANEEHPHCIEIKRFIRKKCEFLIAEKGVIHFISGGAIGVDTWAMEAVLDLKVQYPQITLECALPYAGMPGKFAFEDRKRYDGIALELDKLTVLNAEYHRNCMNQRNEYMVDHAAYLIAVWTGIMTGTGRTVQYAKKQGRTVLQFNPETLMPR